MPYAIAELPVDTATDDLIGLVNVDRVSTR